MNQEGDDGVEQDTLKLQLHSIPLNWEQNEEEDDESDEEFSDIVNAQSELTQRPLSSDQPSTSLDKLTASEPSNKETSIDLNDTEIQDNSDDEELIDLSKNFAPTPLNLLKLNFAYQEVIEQQIAVVDRLLQENNYKKSMLTENLNRASQSNGKPPKLEVAIFNKLFFKDDLGHGPENEDINRRLASTGALFLANPMPAVKWKKPLEKELIAGLKRNAQRALMEPLLTQLEHAEDKRKANETPEILSKIEEVQKRMKEIKNVDPLKLLKDSRNSRWDWDFIANCDLDNAHDPLNCELYWKNHLHPSINHSSWSKEEDKKFLELLKKHKDHNWNVIAEELGTNRSVMNVVRRYQLKINSSFRTRPWTPEEDTKYLKLVEKYRVGSIIPYSQIALHMKSRYAAQLVHRWTKTLNPSFKKSKFTPEEDAALLRAVAEYGRKWARIRDSGMIPGRNDAQLRERFVNCLIPNKKTCWTKEDDVILIKLVEEEGEGNWSAIANRMKNRTDCQCLRRWKSIKMHESAGSKLRYRRDTIKDANISKLRKKLRTVISNELSSQKKYHSVLIEGQNGTKPSNLTADGAISNGPSISSDDVVREYANVASQPGPERKKSKKRQAPREIKQCDKEAYQLIAKRFRPMTVQAITPDTPFNIALKNIQKNSVDITAKAIFVHFIKALNVNAERALESIKLKAENMKNNRGQEETQKIDKNNSTESEANKPEAKTSGGFARNLYLPLCAPNRATVKAHRDMSKDRDRRVTSAKTILELPDTSKTADKPTSDDVKYKPEELLAHLRATYKYKVFRSRFNALFTWPTLLSSLVPYTRRPTDHILYPAVKPKRLMGPIDTETGPPPAKQRKRN